MTALSSYPPLRSLADVREIERVPLAERIDTWDFAEWLRRGCALAPTKAALHYVADGNPETTPVTWSHAELWQRAMRIANLLRASGVGPDDVVAIALPTMPQLYASLLGAFAAGIAFPVNWMLGSAQLAPLLASVRTKAIVTLGPTPNFGTWEAVQAAWQRLPDTVRVFSVTGPGGARRADSDLDTLSAVCPDRPVGVRGALSGDETAAYVHSGGTTGLPKVVRLTHRGFCYRHWATNHTLACAQDEVVFADTPLFHIGGLVMRGLGPVANGNTSVIPSVLGARDKTYIANYWKFVEKYRITRLSGVPTTLSVLVKNPPAGEDISSFRRTFATGSTAVPVALHRALEEKIGVRPLVMYGMTENTGNLTLDPRDGPTRYGSSGIRLPYMEMRSVQLDRNGRIARESAPDEVGAIIYRGPGLTPGYVDADHNAGAFIDGWFNSGDLGRIDADGYVWITGRAKDIIIRGGHNIDPRVIEEALLQSSDVALVAAVASPDAYAGEVPVAYVQRAAGSRATSDELLAFAGQHIGERAAIPKELIFIDQMPLTEVGKPRKVVLRQDAARRALADALAAVAGAASIDVEIELHEVRGMLAIVHVRYSPDEGRPELDARIVQALAPYTIAYRIVWEPAEAAAESV